MKILAEYQNPNESNKTMRQDLFREFLNFFWLRPENALLLALRAEVYRSTFDKFGDGSGTLDVSCGDGVFSFIALGGKLTKETDMFRSLNLTKNREDNFDVFDAFSEEYFVGVAQEAERAYEYGSDWKENLLAKAKQLDFYKNLLHHDNNFPLPIEDQKINYAYSNSAYWVDNFEGHLADLARVTAPGGRIVLEMKTSEITRFTAQNYLPGMGSKFHDIIDAGRMGTWKGLRSKEQILKIIEQIPNTRVESVKPIYGDIMAMIWDVGLRPLFYPLSKMANNLTLEQRVHIKDEWCQIFMDLFSDLLESYEATDKDAIEYCIILEKE